jgi:hypothetical protein
MPALRQFVHDTTAKYRVQFSEAYVNNVSDLVDCIKLLAVDANNDGGTRSSRKLKLVFEQEMKNLDSKIGVVAREFTRKAELKVQMTLQPSLEIGAANGHASALSTVASWGSKSRRTRQENSPLRNGLYWSTYQAVVRRDGVYTSGSAGNTDFNQELCDPMEKNFGPAWREIMDTSLRSLLAECESQVLTLCDAVDGSIINGFLNAGIDKARLASMANAASRSRKTAVKASFQAMRAMATDSQRNLNRSLLPKIQESMKDGYTSGVNVERGVGRFARMKNALESHSQCVVSSMFSESTVELLGGVGNLIKQLSAMILATTHVVTRTLQSVYSIFWDDQSSHALMDQAHLEKVRECRNQCLPALIELRKVQDEVFDLLGIEREELELMSLASIRLSNAKRKKSRKQLRRASLSTCATRKAMATWT